MKKMVLMICLGFFGLTLTAGDMPVVSDADASAETVTVTISFPGKAQQYYYSSSAISITPYSNGTPMDSFMIEEGDAITRSYQVNKGSTVKIEFDCLIIQKNSVELFLNYGYYPVKYYFYEGDSYSHVFTANSDTYLHVDYGDCD